MALKMDRQIDSVELGYFLNETASRGVVLSASTAGSGVAMEDPVNVATVSANSSGVKVLGVLLQDVVNLDLTRTPINWHKDQAQQGSKVTILTKGWVVTDKVTGTPTGGDFAMLSSSGVVTTRTAIATYNSAANPTVGRFRSKVDENGFAKLYVDL